MAFKEELIEPRKVTSRRFALALIDLVLLFIAFTISTWFKELPFSVYFTKYWLSLAGFSIVWLSASALFEKYNLTGEEFLPHAKNILLSNLGSFSFIVVLLILFRFVEFSRTIVFGTILGVTILEFFVFGTWFLIKQSIEVKETTSQKKTRGRDAEAEVPIASNKKISSSRLKAIKTAIAEELGEDMLEVLSRYVDISLESTLIVATNTRFNIDNQPSGIFKTIINIKRINDTRYINKFFEAVNAKLPKGGLFICIAETKEQRKKRILSKYPPIINYLFYTADYIVKRVFPKFSFTKGLYFFLTRGQNRVISRAEALGRLFSCGFDIVDEFYTGKHFVMVSRKLKKPAYDMEATYGPLIKLKRVGKGGAIIRVYKMRTMHPYAEYLQDYIYKKHSLDEGGKFKNDFRVSTAGRIMRRLWIDELPMLINLVRGDLKIVGVRPLSLHYFSLYTKELQEKRVKYKPGLIPPFYVDNPKTLDEIMASEMKYLLAYEKRPFFTDLRYFLIAIFNIVFRKYRSS